jgi:hypothetical protein
MTRIRPEHIGALALLVVALVACSTQSPSGSASPGASRTPGGSGDASATSSAAASAAATAGALPSLEGLIPDKVGGMTLEKTSMKGSDFVGSSDADPGSIAFLKALGVAPADIGVAFGYGFDASTSAGFAMFVFQAAGADESRLITVFTSASSQGRSTPLDWQPATVSGKSVRVATDTEQQNIKLYLYGHGDVLFVLSATSEAVVSDALAKLP